MFLTGVTYTIKTALVCIQLAHIILFKSSHHFTEHDQSFTSYFLLTREPFTFLILRSKLICSFKLLLYNFLCSDKLSALVKGPSCRAIQIIRADTTTCFDRIKPHKIAVRTRSAQKLSTISDI